MVCNECKANRKCDLSTICAHDDYSQCVITGFLNRQTLIGIFLANSSFDSIHVWIIKSQITFFFITKHQKKNKKQTEHTHTKRIMSIFTLEEVKDQRHVMSCQRLFLFCRCTALKSDLRMTDEKCNIFFQYSVFFIIINKTYKLRQNLN